MEGQLRRPLLRGLVKEGELAALMADRASYYRKCDRLIEVDGREIASIVDQVVSCVEQWRGVRNRAAQ